MIGSLAEPGLCLDERAGLDGRLTDHHAWPDSVGRLCTGRPLISATPISRLSGGKILRGEDGGEQPSLSAGSLPSRLILARLAAALAVGGDSYTQ